ncbi:MAG TPA: ferredoxin family protein [Microthrixaceae bacterium]|nr:ferredoxin family protein [Microthrixaceae bacterium]
MGEPYVITEACVDVTDRACVDVCPVQCIYELVDGTLVSKDSAEGEVANTHPAHPDLQFLYGDRMLYINPDECTSCDACMPVCPVDAIYPADKVPSEMAEFIDTNRYVFGDVSAPA